MTATNVIILLLKLSIVISVLAIGLKATFADALYLFRRHAQLGRAVLAMNVIMPTVALAIALAFDLHPVVKLGLVVLSVSPIPPILPNKAITAGGKEDYVIGLLVAISILSVIFIPLSVEVFEWVSKVPLSMRAYLVFMTVLITVLAPLFVGIIFRALLPTIADRAAKPVALVGLILLVLCCVPILLGSAKQFWPLVGNGTLLALSAFAIIGLVVGHLLGGPAEKNRPVLALAASTRHPAVALSIAHTNFPELKMAGAVILLYLLLSIILSIPYLKWIKRSRSKSSDSGNRIGQRVVNPQR